MDPSNYGEWIPTHSLPILPTKPPLPIQSSIYFMFILINPKYGALPLVKNQSIVGIQRYLFPSLLSPSFLPPFFPFFLSLIFPYSCLYSLLPPLSLPLFPYPYIYSPPLSVCSPSLLFLPPLPPLPILPFPLTLLSSLFSDNTSLFPPSLIVRIRMCPPCPSLSFPSSHRLEFGIVATNSLCHPN